MTVAAETWIDPYGANEYLCNDMTLEEIAPGLVRVRILYREKSETILRCTLLLPAHVVLTNMARTTDYLNLAMP